MDAQTCLKKLQYVGVLKNLERCIKALKRLLSTIIIIKGV